MNTQAEPERTSGRSGRATLAWGLLILLACLAQLAWRLALPADGWTFPLDLPEEGQRWTFDAYVGRTPTPIQAGDVLVAIEGQPISDILGNAFRLRPQPPAGWQVGATVTYTVLREGQTLNLPVRLARRTVGQYLGLLLDTMLSAGVLGLLLQVPIAAFILYRRPQDRTAQIFFLWNMLILSNLLSMPLSGQSGAPAELFSLAYLPTSLFNLLVYPFAIVPGEAHLFLVFPVLKAPMRRRPRMTLLLIYGLPPLVFVPQALAHLDTPRQVWTVFLDSGAGLVAPAALLVAVASLVHTLATNRSTIRRAQARWLLAGFTLSWGIGNGALFFLEALGVLKPSPLLSVSSAVLVLVFPLTLAITIFRYRLFDIDLIIRRTLVYGLLTALLAGVYFAAVTVLSSFFSAVSGQQSALAIVLATLAIAALFNPLRVRLQAFIDRRFYRQRYDAARALEVFARTTRDEVELEVLTAELLGVMQETVQPEHVSLTLTGNAVDGPPHGPPT